MLNDMTSNYYVLSDLIAISHSSLLLGQSFETSYDMISFIILSLLSGIWSIV